MYVPDITEIWDEILSEKMIKKNRQYGNSVYDEDTIFSNIGDPEELIKIRLDDKMRRLKTLDPASSKYDSELMEIVAYLMHLLNWRRNSDKYKELPHIEHAQCRCKPDILYEMGDLSGVPNEKFWYEDIEGTTLTCDNRQSRDTVQSAYDIGEDINRRIRDIVLRRLSDK